MKTRKPMKLSRETLKQLSASQLPLAVGMAAVTRLRSECYTYYATYCPAQCK
ncbi:MAG TPA: hypothetical protein VKY89_03895 [Thermoanaerobaculia bacterium]|jgi:hypothetical protein|nr:hypothetical protein [Thermoanaerobaculia bacterium]